VRTKLLVSEKSRHGWLNFKTLLKWVSKCLSWAFTKGGNHAKHSRICRCFSEVECGTKGAWVREEEKANGRVYYWDFKG
jgi:hypothetical protein